MRGWLRAKLGAPTFHPGSPTSRGLCFERLVSKKLQGGMRHEPMSCCSLPTHSQEEKWLSPRKANKRSRPRSATHGNESDL